MENETIEKTAKAIMIFFNKAKTYYQAKKNTANISRILQKSFRRRKKFLKSNHANTRNQKLTQIDKEEKNI